MLNLLERPERRNCKREGSERKTERVRGGGEDSSQTYDHDGVKNFHRIPPPLLHTMLGIIHEG